MPRNWRAQCCQPPLFAHLTVVATGHVQRRGPVVNLQVVSVEAWAMARGDEAVYSPHDTDTKEA